MAKQAVKVQFLHDSLGTQINYKLSLHEFRLQIWASGANLFYLQKEEIS